jgi:aryl-alcohol dehydrogenase-like predicted oxidoreductase
MEFTKLGRSGMFVSRLCLGTMNFSKYTDEAESFRIMDQALDAGINFFDTANVYGSSQGSTEELIGRWFAQGGSRRSKVILATKVYGEMKNPDDGPNQASGLSAYKIRRQIDGSLKRLQTDHVELYQMHHVDRTASWSELWSVFDDLVHQGKVYYVGSSNFAGWDLAVAQYEAQNRHLFGLVSEQHKFSLMTRQPELEVLPAAQALGIGVIPWSPLENGLLGRNALNPEAKSRSELSRDRISRHRDQLLAFEKLCREFGYPQDIVALAWLLQVPGVTAPIIGPRTSAQLEESIKALDVHLDESQCKALDQVFPGPGGPAPRAYAW